MIVEWVRRDDGALLRRNPRPYSTVIRPPQHASERLRARSIAKSVSLPSSRLYIILSCLSLILPFGRKIYRGVTELVDTVRQWTAREWEEQREREVRFPGESITMGLSNRGGYESRSPLLVPQFSSQSLWVYSRLRGSRTYIHNTSAHPHAHWLDRSYVYTRTRTSTNECKSQCRRSLLQICITVRGKGKMMKDKDRQRSTDLSALPSLANSPHERGERTMWRTERTRGTGLTDLNWFH